MESEIQAVEKGLIALLVCSVCSLPAFVYAYLIKVKKRLHLVMGCDPDRIANHFGLAIWVAGLFAAIGCVIFATGVLAFAFSGHGWLAYGSLLGGLLILLLCIVLVRGARRFKDSARRSEEPSQPEARLVAEEKDWVLEGGSYVPKTTWAGLQIMGGIFLFWLIIFGSIVYFGLRE